MPYIIQSRRPQLEPKLAPQNAGELNFVITKLCINYLDEIKVGATPNYADINEAIGALECAKLELYRRLAAPYEDRKISTNGDAYT